MFNFAITKYYFAYILVADYLHSCSLQQSAKISVVIGRVLLSIRFLLQVNVQNTSNLNNTSKGGKANK